MDHEHMGDDLAKVLLTEEQIQARLAELAADIWKDYEGKEFLLVGVLKGHELDIRVLGIDFGDFLFLSLLHDGCDRGFLEIGKRPGLVRVRRHDRVLVQVVEFLARVGASAFRSKFCLRHCQSLMKS